MEDSQIVDLYLQRDEAAVGHTAKKYGPRLRRLAYGIVDDRQIYYDTGSAPPYATALVVHPESGLGVVVLMNTERYPLRHGIPQMILNTLDPK